MASIPVYKAQARLSQGAPVAIGGTDTSMLVGQAVEGLGKGLMNVAQAENEKVLAQNRAAAALYKSSAQVDIDLEFQSYAQKAKLSSAPDGSDIFQQWEAQTEELRKKIDSIEDNARRGYALDAFADRQRHYIGQLEGYRDQKFASFYMNESENLSNKLSDLVTKDVSKLPDAFKQWDEYAAQAPFAGKEQQKFLNAGKRNLVTSIVNDMVEKGNYDVARNILNSAGELYSPSEKDKVADDISREQVSRGTQKWTDERRSRMKLEQDQKDQADEFMLKGFDLREKFDDDVTRANFVNDVKKASKAGLISPRHEKAILSDVDKRENDAAVGTYMKQIYSGGNYDQIKNQIIDDLGNGELNNADARTLMNMLKSDQRKATADPRYKEQLQLSRQYIKANLFPMGKQFGTNELVLYDVEKRASELRNEGKTPELAARQAVAEKVGVAGISPDPMLSRFPGRGLPAPQETAALMAYGEQITKNANAMRAQGKMTKEAEAEFVRMRSSIIFRIKHLEQKAILDEIQAMPQGKK